MPSENSSSSSSTGDYRLTVPDWLNQSFLERAYEGYLGAPSVIDSFAIEAATGKGENYASSMYRVKSIYSTEKEVIKSDALSLTFSNTHAIA